MIKSAFLIASALLTLAGCGEKPQDSANARKKADVAAWQGASNTGYVEPGWTVGDAKSWETQMTNRAQAQNEYVRVGVGGK